MTIANRRARPAWRAAVPALVAAAAAACTLLPPPGAAPRSTYLLGPEIPQSGAPSARCRTGTATLLVTLPREEPGFDTARMVYLRRPNAVSYYSESQWADAPARMLAPLIARALEDTGCWRAVLRTPTTVSADFRLDSEDLVLGQEFFSRPSRARLALRAVLVDARDDSVVAVRRFEEAEDAPSDDAAGGAAAAGRAAAKLARSVAAWAAESLPSDRPGR